MKLIYKTTLLHQWNRRAEIIHPAVDTSKKNTNGNLTKHYYRWVRVCFNYSTGVYCPTAKVRRKCFIFIYYYSQSFFVCYLTWLCIFPIVIGCHNCLSTIVSYRTMMYDKSYWVNFLCILKPSIMCRFYECMLYNANVFKDFLENINIHLFINSIMYFSVVKVRITYRGDYSYWKMRSIPEP